MEAHTRLGPEESLTSTLMKLSSARTQSTNGLAERYVALVEEILRTCVNYKQTDWEEMIPHIEFVVNNQNKDTLTGLAPTKVELGIVPVLPADHVCMAVFKLLDMNV